MFMGQLGHLGHLRLLGQLGYRFLGRLGQLGHLGQVGHLGQLKGHFTGMLCAPSRTILSTHISRDLIVPAYASGERSEGDGDC